MNQEVDIFGDIPENDLFGPDTSSFCLVDEDETPQVIEQYHFSTDVPESVARLSVGNDIRYIEPPLVPELPKRCIHYDNARQIAAEIHVTPGTLHYGWTSGTFVFGDFIEAFFVEHNLHTTHMRLATLSMSENNVDSLANLLNGGYVDKLDLLFSHYNYVHKRGTLIPYMYKELDKNDRFQLAVARQHLKLCVFTTDCGKHIGFRGSANLSSADCMEFLLIQENPTLNAYDNQKFDFVFEYYSTIKKPVGGRKLWQKAIAQPKTEKEKEAQKAEVPAQKAEIR